VPARIPPCNNQRSPILSRRLPVKNSFWWREQQASRSMSADLMLGASGHGIQSQVVVDRLTEFLR
jgi:hypothetical protein